MARFTKAEPAGSHLLIGIAGRSGSGKSMSALEIATGIADVTGRPIGMVDTENGRGKLYADRYDYLHARLDAPFSPEAYMKALADAHAEGVGVLIIDSASHEHEGEGGVLAEADRIAGGNDKKKMLAWAQVKPRHRLFVDHLTRTDMHVVVCMRARPKVGVGRDGKPVELGLTPIVPEGLDFEMDCSFMLPDGAEGVPDLRAPRAKMVAPLVPLVEPGKPLSRALGRRLAEWATRPGDRTKSSAPAGAEPQAEQREPELGGRSDLPPPPNSSAPSLDLDALKMEAREVAEGAGLDAYRDWFSKRPGAEKRALIDCGAHETNKKLAAEGVPF